jgi:ATP-dependent Clp protease protease subunit
MQQLIAENTGQDVATIDADSQRDRWFTAEQAREYGLVDAVVERVEDVRLGTARRVGL